MSRRLRIAVLHDDRPWLSWQRDCISSLFASRYVELVLRVTPAALPPSVSRSLLQHYCDRWVQSRSRALAEVAPSAAFTALPELQCAVRLVETDLTRLREAELDVILQLGALDLDEALLDCAQHGVWRFAHDSDWALSSNAVCLEPLLEGSVTTPNELLRLLPGGHARVLHRGHFSSCRASLTHNLDRVLGGSAGFCARVCAETANTQLPDLGAPVTPFRPQAESARDDRTLAQLVWRMGRALASRAFELAFYVQDWNVGVVQKDLRQIVQAASIGRDEVRWLPEHAPGRFIADPFGFEHDGEQHILVEEYDHLGKGRISLVADENKTLGLSLEVVLDLPEHMSYPCVFREGQALYMLPELYQTQSAQLYRREGNAWVREQTLLKGAPIVDPTLFKHEGRYWILCSLADDGAYGNQMLHGYFADSLHGPFQAHPLNPLKCDIGSSRPAGSPFVVDGVLYRPSQDCSRTYGGALVIQRVDRLSPTEFRESRVARLTPAADGPYPDGLHTLNGLGERALIDGKRFVFDWLGARKNWELRRELFW